jgi:hypothetical protein
MKTGWLGLLVLLAPTLAAADPPSLRAGNYFCQVTDHGVVYAPQPCSITRTRGGAWIFEKSGGSQRFALVVLPTAAGFRASGLFFCPRGGCDAWLNADFEARPQGDFVGTLQEEYLVNVSRRRQTTPPTPF